MRIVLAVDGSASADRAVDLVAALPWRDGGRVRIVSVAPSPAELGGIPWTAAATAAAAETEVVEVREHRRILAAAERELRSARCDLVIEPVLLRGRAGSAIVDAAREMPADLVVIGHRGLGGWESALLGSVSAEVVDHAPCSVLVARDDRIGSVVLAHDGSLHARAAESIMTHCPLFTGVPTTVVSVADGGFPTEVAVAPILYAEGLDAQARAIEAEMATMEAACLAAAARLRAAGVAAESEVRVGDPAHEIIALARARGAGVIVVGTRGQTGLRRLILGSVARNVLLHAPCSVLVARERVRAPTPTVQWREEPELVSPFG